MEKLAARRGASGVSSGSARPLLPARSPLPGSPAVMPPRPRWGRPGAGLTRHMWQVHLQLVQQDAAVGLEDHHLRARPGGQQG